jgi:hypothetical protein
MKRLVLFIHGLGGSAEGTWQKFPQLTREDSELSALYDVRTFEYSTGILGSKPSLATCASILKTEIENRYPDYNDIALIVHSQGGLLARYYIAERLNSGQPLRVSRLLTFATPHHGSGLATVLKKAPFTSQQSEDLDPNSLFLQALGIAWGQAKADQHVLTKHVVAASDAIVGQVSAMGTWSPGYEVVGGAGHVAVVKPKNAEDISFLIAKRFLLKEDVKPGGVEADYRAPLLRFNHVEAKASTRFIYSARVLPFIGREAEIDTLTDFLGGLDQPFQWAVMYGSGGVGKSRLALELCLAARSDWHAGFLPPDGKNPDWGRWQPLMPTLIVVDYAARDAERTGQVLRALAGRGAPDGTTRLAAPVRFLLLERANEGEWLDKIVGIGTTKARVSAARAPDVHLATISDLWPIFDFVLGQAKMPLPDKSETLAALEKIDRERRPLFAYFMADAIAAGHDIRHFDAASLLEEVIDRGREAFWKPAGVTAKEERLLALATMTGGLPVSLLSSLTEKLLPSWDVDRHPVGFRAMTGRESGENIWPLQPDIVGEHFTLACIAQSNLSDQDRARFCGLAWRIDPLSMGQFTLLAHRDVPNHPMLRWVRKMPEAKGWSQLFWAEAIVTLTSILGAHDVVTARALLDDLRNLARTVGIEALWVAWATAAYNLAGAYNPIAGRALLDDIRSVAVKRNEPRIWEAWAKAATNLTAELASTDQAAARALAGDMRDVAAKRQEPLLWEAWAKANLNLVNESDDPNESRALLDQIRGAAEERDEAGLWEVWARAAVSVDLGSHDPVAARSLLNEMLHVAEKNDDPELWHAWSKAAFNLSLDIGPGDPVAAKKLLDEMRDAASKRNAAALWQEWAKAAVNLTIEFGPRDRLVAEGLVGAIREVATVRDEPALWESWARATQNLIANLGPQHLGAAQVHAENLEKVATKRNEAFLWEAWAKAAVNLAQDFGPARSLTAWRLLNKIRTVATEHDGPMMWKLWANAAANVTNHLGSRSVVGGQRILREMREVAEKRNEAAMWEGWAKGAAALMNHLGSSDLAVARALLQEVRDVAARYEEVSIWAMWAATALNLIVHLGTRDPVEARAVLDAMRGLAANHDELSLWHYWAKAVVNLTGDFRSTDPVGASALLGELREAAVMHNDRSLWQFWAVAAINLAIELRSHDPLAARTLLDEMRAVAAAQDDSKLWLDWATAATYLTKDLGPDDPAAARTLLNDMYAVAAERGEKPLWDKWAKAAFNVAKDLKSSDPPATQKLLDEMHAAAVASKEPLLWEWWSAARKML